MNGCRVVGLEPHGTTHVVSYLPEGPVAQVQNLAVSPDLSGRESRRCIIRPFRGTVAI
jgi:hypothetical protein